MGLSEVGGIKHPQIRGEESMALSQEAEKTPFFGENAVRRPLPSELLALKRHSQFYEFLRDELETCRTETERDVVLSALLKAQMEFRRLVKKLNLPFAAAGEKNRRGS
jgi:hypothetical protein